MNLVLQRKIDRIVGTVICGIFSLFPKKGKSVPVDAGPKRILVILLSEMGSLILAGPMFDTIKKKYPNASIYTLLFERNKEFLEILDVISPKNIFTVDADSIYKLLRDSIRALIDIRQNRIDTVIDCELFSRISSIYSFLSGASIRVGFHPHNQEGLFRGSFITHPVLYNPYHHISQQFITLASAIESNTVPKVKRLIDAGSFKATKIKIGQREMEEFRSRFKTDLPQIKGKKLVFLYPSGGLLPIRAWPLKNFCIVAKNLTENGYIVGIIGMSSDKKFADTILAYCSNEDCIDLTGYTKSVRELMLMFHFGSLLITNDGGPGHFASMTPIPSIIFFGPETPRLYGTLDKKSVEFYVPLSCSPCLTAYNHRASPCDGNNVCLKSIQPKAVLEKAHEILEG